MRITRLIPLALAAVLALAVAGIAIAHGGGGPAQKTEEVTADFTASPVADKSRSKQCTGVDGTYTISKGVDQGTSTGDPRLSGKITIKSKTVVNNDTGLGWSQGRTFINDADTGKLKAVAGFTATLKNGALEGFAIGKVKNPAPAGGSTKAREGHGRKGKFHSELLANFSATIGQDGSVSGKIGGGGGDNVAILHGNPCSPPQRHQGQQGQNDNHQQSGGDHRGDDDRK